MLKAKNKEPEKWTFTSYHSDGTPIDFQNLEDVERVRISIIKGMESIGYKYVEESNTDNPKAI